MNQITLEVIRVPGCQACVLPPLDRVKAGCTSNRRQAVKLREENAALGEELKGEKREFAKKEILAEIKKNEDSAKACEDVSERMLSAALAIRDRYKSVIALESFPFLGLDYGGKLDARAAATSYDENSMPRFDSARYQLELVMRATGLSESDLRKLEPAIAETLIAEVGERVEPEPGRLDFLSSLPLSLETTTE